MHPPLSSTEREHYEQLKRHASQTFVNADPILPERDTAQYIEWSVSTLRKSRLTGDGPPFLKLGKSVRYRKSDVDQWLASRRRRSTSDPGQAA
jgi:predicted DNA-binding transcriptional regulator AlpA